MSLPPWQLCPGLGISLLQVPGCELGVVFSGVFLDLRDPVDQGCVVIHFLRYSWGCEDSDLHSYREECGVGFAWLF